MELMISLPKRQIAASAARMPQARGIAPTAPGHAAGSCAPATQEANGDKSLALHSAPLPSVCARSQKRRAVASVDPGLLRCWAAEAAAGLSSSELSSSPVPCLPLRPPLWLRVRVSVSITAARCPHDFVKHCEVPKLPCRYCPPKSSATTCCNTLHRSFCGYYDTSIQSST